MKKGPPSLIYTGGEARDLDRHQLASLGSSALIELDAAASGAAHFSSFEPTLIGTGAAGALNGPRSLLHPDDVGKLDAKMEKLDAKVDRVADNTSKLAGIRCTPHTAPRTARHNTHIGQSTSPCIDTTGALRRPRRRPHAIAPSHRPAVLLYDGDVERVGRGDSEFGVRRLGP